jgi:hypothetical protein
MEDKKIEVKEIEEKIKMKRKRQTDRNRKMIEI